MTVTVLRKSEIEQVAEQPLYAGLNNGTYISRRVAHLIAEHDDLDLAITALMAKPNCDDLVISRLKKRKLQLKDEIAKAR